MSRTVLDYTSNIANVKLKIYTANIKFNITSKQFNVGWAVKENDMYTDMNEEPLTLAQAMVLFRKALRQIRKNKITFCLVD